jgi:polysaccharide biosynthesis protein PslA
MQIASSVRGTDVAKAPAQEARAPKPLRISRMVTVSILFACEAMIVPTMGIASHEMLASHQLPSEAWPIGTGMMHATLILLGTIAFLASTWLCGGYRPGIGDGLVRSLTVMFTGGAIAALSLAALIYATSGDSWSQWSWFWTWITTSSGALIGVRIIDSIMVNRLAKAGDFDRNIVIFGVGDIGQQLLGNYFADAPDEERIVGVFDDRAERSPDYCCGYEILGDIDDLIEFARDTVVDEIIVALPVDAYDRLAKVFAKLRELPVDVLVTLPTLRVNGEPLALNERCGMPVAKVMQRPLTDWKLIGKELEDRILGLLILILISPILLVIAVLIKLESPGPVFFRQMRYGYNNRMIEVLKFRSMRHDLSDANAEKLTTKNDPRVTKLGAILRRTSLDELPQFINVVRGEMSIVGPRPHARSAKAGGLLYHDAVADYPVRHKVKPGITGLAQISGWRGETRTVEQIQRRVEHDIAYINNWSLLTDLKIIVLTILTGFGGRNAY